MKRVAVIVMPWVDAEYCPLGAASLKSYLEARGVATDVLYFNLLMADRLGAGLFRALSRSDEPWPEWLFSRTLFGAELPDLRDPGLQEFLRVAGLSTARWRRLAREETPAFLRDCLADADWRRYDLIGFSSSMHSHAACLALAKDLKDRHPETPIAIGGPNASGPMGRETLRGCAWIDYAVDGEGEEALLCLVQGRRPPAQAVVSAPVDFASTPPPDHGDYFRQRAKLPGLATGTPRVTFEASRGCWWGEKQHCTFCGIPDEALRYRSKPAAAAAREILELSRRHRTGRLHACDLIMSLDHLGGLTSELASTRRREGLDLELYFEVKSNLAPEHFEALARAGVLRIQPGIESLSTPTLRLMRKGVSAIRNVQTLKLALAHGIEVNWNLLHGFPGEDAAELDSQARLVPSITHLAPPRNFAPVRPDRFSPYQAEPARFGLRPPVPAKAYEKIYPRGRFRLEDLVYFFRFAEKRAKAGGARGRLERAVASWSLAWPRNFFACRRGSGFVELFDSRPLRPGAGLEVKTDVLTGLEAELFRLCETIRTLPGLLAAVPDRTPACVRRALAGMTRRRWLMREGDSYLALAVPVSRLPPSQRWAFERLVDGAVAAIRPKRPVGYPSPI